eukprot:115998-Chlamydomonas_euryale.AAC.1
MLEAAFSGRRQPSFHGYDNFWAHVEIWHFLLGMRLDRTVSGQVSRPGAGCMRVERLLLYTDLASIWPSSGLRLAGICKLSLAARIWHST